MIVLKGKRNEQTQWLGPVPPWDRAIASCLLELPPRCK